MSIVLDERKYAEEIIEKGEVGSKPTSTLFLLSKYYRQNEELSEKKTVQALHSFMAEHYKNYNPVLWEDIIDDIAKKGKKYLLQKIDYIGITQNEIDQISKVTSLKYQKLLFAMLCYAKFYNATSKKNNNWVNTDIKEIYRVARVTVKHRNDKFLYLNDLETTGLISFSNKNDNLNMKVNFIDTDGDTVLKITDFRELGYEYEQYMGENKFIRCSECNLLIKKKTNNQRYCPECATKINIQKQKERDRLKNLDSENA